MSTWAPASGARGAAGAAAVVYAWASGPSPFNAVLPVFIGAGDV